MYRKRMLNELSVMGDSQHFALTIHIVFIIIEHILFANKNSKNKYFKKNWIYSMSWVSSVGKVTRLWAGGRG